MFSIAEWRDTPAKRRLLLEALSQPILKDAFEVIRSAARPFISAKPTTIEAMAIHHAKLAGIHETIDLLFRMTTKREKPPEPQKESFNILTPDETEDQTQTP